jgi:hypothetical protein
VSGPEGELRLRDLGIAVLLVASVGYFGVALAGPEGGCIPGGSDVGYRWNATVTADPAADEVTVRNTGPSMGPSDRTATLVVRVRGDGDTATHTVLRDRAFRPDIGFPLRSGANRTLTGVRVGGRDLRPGDRVAVLHRTSRLEPYCIRGVDTDTLRRTTA